VFHSSQYSRIKEGKEKGIKNDRGCGAAPHEEFRLLSLKRRIRRVFKTIKVVDKLNVIQLFITPHNKCTRVHLLKAVEDQRKRKCFFTE